MTIKYLLIFQKICGNSYVNKKFGLQQVKFFNSFNLYLIPGKRNLLLFVNTNFTHTVLIVGTTGAMYITFLTMCRLWLRVHSYLLQ